MPRTAARSANGVDGVRRIASRFVLAPVVRATVRLDVVDADRLDGLDPPYVVVANHSSHLDAPVLMTALPREVTRRLAVGAAADYFFDARWRAVLTGLFFNAFPVHRKGTGGTRGLAADLLDDGTPLLLFPEGTRSRDGSLGPFKPGAAALCVSRGVPLVPVGLVGTSEAMPTGRRWPRRGRPAVHVVVGEPLVPGPRESARELAARAADAVATLVGTGSRGTSEGPRGAQAS